jgi:hypothetical protein
MLGKCSTFEPHLRSFSNFHFETASHYVAQADLELAVSSLCAGIIGVHHHTWVNFILKNHGLRWAGLPVPTPPWSDSAFCSAGGKT